MLKTIIGTVALCFLLISTAAAQEAAKIPNLAGTWEGGHEMHFKNKGFLKHAGKGEPLSSQLVVERQEGQVLHGHVGWKHKDVGQDTFSGVIENDGQTFYLVGHTEGIRIGKMDGPDAFTLYILQPGGTNPRAGLSRFTRVKQ
ncbi:hypothetical protein [Megalodesulfovibrio paquesii]